MRPGSPNACSAHALPACADFSVCRLLCSILFTPAALCLRSLNFPPAGFLHRESSQGSSVSASNSNFNRRAMAWSASSGSTRPLQEDRNNILGLVTSGRTSICPGIPKGGIKKRSHHFIVKGECEEDDLSDGPCNAAEKKRRLTADQVKFLEMSFSMDLKLEPERKALLAKKLGIRPRQVAIWFQNRRARWKNKQLEQDFENLKASFDAVMTEKENILLERESVLEENKRLQEEVMRLQGLLERTRNVGPSDTAGTGSEGKSGLTSLNKSSEDQGEIQDSGQSCPLPGETAGMEAMAPTVWDLNPGLMCSVSVKAECDHAPIFPIDEFFGPSNCTLLFHPSTISGVYFEDGFYSNYYDGHLTGLACHEYIEP